MNQVIVAVFVMSLMIISTSMFPTEPVLRLNRDFAISVLCAELSIDQSANCEYGDIQHHICGTMCAQGPDQKCNSHTLKCHPKLQCIEKQCRGCLTAFDYPGSEARCSHARYNNS